jgi:para-nitrobenzyl esterase
MAPVKLLPILAILAVLSACAIDKGPPGVGASRWQPSWQLVRIQDGSGAVVVPDVKAKYTMEFDALGGVTMRIDCNRGSGKWKSPAPGRIEFSQLALTRAACPPGSLHDRIVTQLPQMRSYLVKNNRLYLSLVADGGIYEWERY